MFDQVLNNPLEYTAKLLENSFEVFQLTLLASTPQYGQTLSNNSMTTVDEFRECV